MASTDELIEQIESLPVEGRARVVDSLLRTMNQPDPTLDAAWVEVAQRRLAELRSGNVSGVSVDEIAAKARKRFGK